MQGRLFRASQISLVTIPNILVIRKSVWSEVDLSFAVRITQLVKEHAGGDNAAFGELCGASPETVRLWTIDKSKPSMDKLALISRACKVSLDWLILGDTPNSLDSPNILVHSEGFSVIPRYDVRASAGPGAVVASGDLDGAGFMAFRTEWLRRLGINPQRAEVILAVGDSMEPTIHDGDVILVDRSIDKVVDNGIYVVTLGNLVLVKRVQTRRDGSAVLKSDNQRYDDEVVPAHELPDLKIEGRVRWFGRTI